jgi:SAM-dependent methyltransferase
MNCKICRTQITENNNIQVCHSCGHIYRNYNGDHIEYHREIYRNHNNKHQQRGDGEINSDGSINVKFHKNRSRIVFDRVQQIKPYLFSGCTILDIGSGAGTFALSLKKHSEEIECLEISDNLIRECERLGFYTYKKDFLQQSFDKRFDIVTCFHVLEHVEDATTFINKCYNICNKYVIFEVPTLKCYFGKENRTRALTNPNKGYYDGHCHYFSLESMKVLFEEKFDIISITSGIQAPAILLIGEKK